MTNCPKTQSPLRKVFVVRVWQSKDRAVEWVGEVQDVSSGTVEHTHGLQAILDLLRARIQEPISEKNEPAGPPAKEKP